MTIPTAPSALKATGLRKSFGQKTVLDGIDLDIAEGTTFSLLGPNGAGMFAGLTLALTWLAVAFGLFAKTPEGANSLSLIMLVLPFVSSAFVPTDSMPAGVRWFARNQPFTPIIDTLRGLLTGTPIGHNAPLAAAWCAGG
jgi:hypothetical protein